MERGGGGICSEFTGLEEEEGAEKFWENVRREQKRAAQKTEILRSEPTLLSEKKSKPLKPERPSSLLVLRLSQQVRYIHKEPDPLRTEL